MTGNVAALLALANTYSLCVEHFETYVKGSKRRLARQVSSLAHWSNRAVGNRKRHGIFPVIRTTNRLIRMLQTLELPKVLHSSRRTLVLNVPLLQLEKLPLYLTILLLYATASSATSVISLSITQQSILSVWTLPSVI